MLGLDYFEGFELGVPDVLTQGQRVLGEDCVGGGGNVVIFGWGDGHGKDWGGVRWVIGGCGGVGGGGEGTRVKNAG